MAKRDQSGGSGTDEERARRRLDQAQMELRVAQRKRDLVIAEGEHNLEAARQRAARRLQKATRKVEQRAEEVSRAEEELAAITQQERSGVGEEAR
jgi:hypothetical protein